LLEQALHEEAMFPLLVSGRGEIRFACSDGNLLRKLITLVVGIREQPP
jgi:hypothetical protein